MRWHGQARQVSTLSPLQVTLALDGDPAGHDGATRWVDLLHRQLSHPVAVADLPAGKDPADVLVEVGPEALRSLLTKARYPAYELSQLTGHRPAPAPRPAFSPHL